MENVRPEPEPEPEPGPSPARAWLEPRGETGPAGLGTQARSDPVRIQVSVRARSTRVSIRASMKPPYATQSQTSPASSQRTVRASGTYAVREISPASAR